MNIEEAHYITELEDAIELQVKKIAMLTEALVVAGLHPNIIKGMLDQVTL